MRAHEAGWAHAAVSANGPAWLREPGDVNALVPQLWSGTACKVDGVLEVGGVRMTDLVAEHGSPAYVLDEVDFRAEVPEPVPAGGCVLFTKYTWHRSEPNRSPHPRRAYAIAYHGS